MNFISNIIKYARQYRIAINISFNYKIPNDILTCIYDFYMLNFLHDNISEKDYKQLTQNKYDTTYRNDKEVEAQINVNQAYNKLCQYLKKQFMNLLYYQIARQFSHLNYFYEVSDNKKYALQQLDQSQKKFLFKYMKVCQINGVTGSGQSKFEDGKKIINILKPDKIFFVKLAYKIFRDIINNNGYGGKNWMNICDAYLMFYNQKADIVIDHVFDLQHNTGSIFYKHPKYSWIASVITEILNNKRDAKYPMQYVNHCSHSIQDACKYLMKTNYNISQDQFIQIPPTTYSLIQKLKQNASSPNKMDNILDELSQQIRGLWNVYHCIIERKIKSKNIPKKLYLYIINNDIDDANIISNLIVNNIITENNLINYGIKFLIKKHKYEQLLRIIQQHKNIDTNILQDIIDSYIKQKQFGILNQLIENNVINKENTIDYIVKQEINNQYYATLYTLIQSGKINNKHIITDIILLFINNRLMTHLLKLLIYNNTLNENQKNLIIKSVDDTNLYINIYNRNIENEDTINKIVQKLIQNNKISFCYNLLVLKIIKNSNIINNIIKLLMDNKQYGYLGKLIKNNTIENNEQVKQIIDLLITNKMSDIIYELIEKYKIKDNKQIKDAIQLLIDKNYDLNVFIKEKKITNPELIKIIEDSKK